MKATQANSVADRPTNGAGRVLVVDDHRRARESMVDALCLSGHRVDGCSSGAEALSRIQATKYDCIVTDLKMPGLSGVELIVQLERLRYGAQIVMVTAHASVASAVEAMRHGAFNYIEKPFDVDQLEGLVGQAIQHGRLPADLPLGHDSATMIGSSPAMQALRQEIAQVAPTAETVLILGESGSGKELVGKAVHAASPRHDGPLISLNCPVLSAQLTESELFGHERGAFTGADTARIGRFEMAHGGSILLDEVTEIDIGLQAKLLRVLQEKSFERVGASETIHVDVRVLATTNRDLITEVAQGRFREDLYFRLAVVPLAVPPLRERTEDIPLLIDHFLTASATRLGRDPCTLDDAALELLNGHYWPGNIRELENVITRASVLCSGAPVTADDLAQWLLAGPNARNQARQEGPPLGLSLEQMERKLIESTLQHFDGHRAQTAEALGIAIRTLGNKLRRYGYGPRDKSPAKAA